MIKQLNSCKAFYGYDFCSLTGKLWRFTISTIIYIIFIVIIARQLGSTFINGLQSAKRVAVMRFSLRYTCLHGITNIHMSRYMSMKMGCSSRDLARRQNITGHWRLACYDIRSI